MPCLKLHALVFSVHDAVRRMVVFDMFVWANLMLEKNSF